LGVLLREALFVDRNLLASVKKLWLLVMINLRNCGWNEEYSRGLTPCVHITRRFKILRAVTLKITGLWNVVNIYQHFRGTCYFHHRCVEMDGAVSFKKFVKCVPDYTASHLRREESSLQGFPAWILMLGYASSFSKS
jgi:hypothetical protein